MDQAPVYSPISTQELIENGPDWIKQLNISDQEKKAYLEKLHIALSEKLQPAKRREQQLSEEYAPKKNLKEGEQYAGKTYRREFRTPVDAEKYKKEMEAYMGQKRTASQVHIGTERKAVILTSPSNLPQAYVDELNRKAY